jgi:hypothetical protein
MPRFPAGICKQTFTRASEFLEAIGYTGPVCISCDDTQLLSKWSPYYDGERDQWLLLGGTGEPVAIDGDTENIKQAITQATVGREKATKASFEQIGSYPAAYTLIKYSSVCGVFRWQPQGCRCSYLQPWQLARASNPPTSLVSTRG